MKAVLLSTLLLTGCGKIERMLTGFTGNLTYKCSKHGIEYVQSDSGLAVSYAQNGNPATCNPGE
jgi:hypothetical protein